MQFARLTMDGTLDRIGELVAAGRAGGSTYQLATVNVDFLVNAEADPELAGILRNADLCMPDGMPIVWASRLFGTRLPERVSGSDLVPLLAAQSAARGWRVHVFGSSPDVAARARTLIRERYPGAAVSIDPGPQLADPAVVDDAVLDGIAATRADILCVALGSPKQERFIAAHRHRLGIPVLVGVGGSFDMLVGERKRAPEWVQRVGLEWVYRTLQEPARLGPRYARDIRVFVPMLWREWRARRAAEAPISPRRSAR
jgi:N-acetylglucosaminyldiphosphoundecaprenol N-acetyl-beta-D-mannosaminyltransferase